VSPETLHRRCCGKARGWLCCVERWGHDDGGFPRFGVWAITAHGASYLGPNTAAVLRRFGGAPAPSRPSETP
jgi:hypothetical protein